MWVFTLSLIFLILSRLKKEFSLTSHNMMNLGTPLISDTLPDIDLRETQVLKCCLATYSGFFRDLYFQFSTATSHCATDANFM